MAIILTAKARLTRLFTGLGLEDLMGRPIPILEILDALLVQYSHKLQIGTIQLFFGDPSGKLDTSSQRISR